MPWATIQAQPISPIARSTTADDRAAAATRRVGGTGGAARTSRTMTKMNDRATVMAAPTR